MSSVDYHKLLYTLEKIRAACKDKYDVFHTNEGEEEHELCLQLYEDGLIDLYLKEESGHHLWKMV